ncbi:MAG TPA: serine hydrolase domain-containing protein [Rhodanobacter sp.]|nr:serine hydrolase domain-containing protein [Rhodanobacter sp.]
MQLRHVQRGRDRACAFSQYQDPREVGHRPVGAGWSRWITTLVTAFAITWVSGAVMAQVPTPKPATATSVVSPALPVPVVAVATTDLQGASTHELTNQDLAAFLDGLMPLALARGDVAGGVISVVKDGKVLFAKGYGYANLAKRTPIAPDSTLFRIGSTSKLFTWTAVMQLVEQGKLNLDRDINDYLDFKIPPYEGKPITLRDVMTHTPGFEDTARNLISTDGKPVNLEHYLKTHLPVRIFAPGEVVAYSNYGCGLAGYIVQRISGQDFDDYIEQHIYKPLDMQHSSFRQPLPAAMVPMMSASYSTASDGKEQAFEIVNPAPAGAMSTTALDMTHFMIAQLQDGRYDDTRILQQATAVEMHKQQHTEAPGLNGFALGFYHEDSHGQRIIGHAGDLDYFHTDLHLLLDANVGVFMSFNSSGDAGGAHVIRAALFSAFLDRYFPTESKQLPVAATAKADAARVAGWYLSSRRNNSGLSMLYAVTQGQVRALPDGTITAAGMNDPAGKPLHWREVGPLQYQQVNGSHKLDFVADANGDILYWATDAEVPVMIFQRVNGLRSLGSVKLWATLAQLFTLSALLVWLCGWLLRRHYRKQLELSPAQRRSRLWSRLGALVLFGTLLGWLILMMAIASAPSLLLEGGAAPWMYVLYVLGVLALLGVLLIVIHAVRTWMAPRRSRWVLLGETVLAFAAVYLAWLIVAFRMISFNTRF